MNGGLPARIEALERANRRLTGAVGALVLALGVAAVTAASQVEPKLRVSELEVVDGRGVVRARLAGDVPDPVIQGRLIRRDSRMSGLILCDHTGQERSGYVTEDRSSNVLLTLDSRHKQSALFVADSAGSTESVLHKVCRRHMPEEACRLCLAESAPDQRKSVPPNP